MTRALKDARVHVFTSARCDNACLFCMEFDARSGRRRGAGLPAERAYPTAQWLLSRLRPEHRGLPVTFTGGEPTLNVSLPMMAVALRERGFSDLGLQTNGRRLRDPAFAIRLIRAGFSRFSLSIHGDSAGAHDAATRSPGSFAQTWRGLEVLLALKRRWPWLRLATTTTATAANVAGLELLLRRLLARSGLDTVVINPLAVEGNGSRHFEELALRHRDLAMAFARALRNLRSEGVERPERAVLVDMPPCVMGGLETHEGRLERVYLIGPVGEPSLLPPKLWFAAAKGPRCGSCARRRDCTGVSPRYAARFGWSEFSPVNPADSPAGASAGGDRARGACGARNGKARR